MASDDKLQAFRNFDFDGNEQWQQHFKNFDISGAQYAEKLMRIKAKWYKRDIDPDFDISLATGTPAPAAKPSPAKPTDTSTSEKSEPTSDTPPKREASSGPRVSAAFATPSALFGAHFVLLILGALSFLPFSTRMMHRYFLQLAIITHGFKIYRQFGGPPFRPFSALKEWAARALPSTDFQYACMSLVFLPRMPTRLVVVPSSVLAAYHVVSFLAAKYRGSALWEKYGRGIHAKMVANQRGALGVNAMSEICVGLFMIVQMLSPARNVLVAFIYWQWLRTRFFSPDAAQYHRQAWQKIGEKANPFLNAVPFLRMPLGYAQRWFASPPRSGF
ncbi:hypothetical protein BSKO_01843 [Bryopsis sp. KO-2023]|nr:hypothetical protein BSKO_01843 [Bryopsis sp. KO-2023]